MQKHEAQMHCAATLRTAQMHCVKGWPRRVYLASKAEAAFSIQLYGEGGA